MPSVKVFWCTTFPTYFPTKLPVETHGGMLVWVLDTLGETSDIVHLLLLPELIRELSKALVQLAKPWSLGCRSPPVASTFHSSSSFTGNELSDGLFALCWLCNNWFNQHLHPLWLATDGRKQQARLQALCVTSRPAYHLAHSRLA